VARIRGVGCERYAAAGRTELHRIGLRGDTLPGASRMCRHSAATAWRGRSPIRRRISCNNMMDEKSELMREGNTLREVAMEQRKADIQITKEFIRSIA
jgi:hypothetical protein